MPGQRLPAAPGPDRAPRRQQHHWHCRPESVRTRYRRVQPGADQPRRRLHHLRNRLFRARSSSGRPGPAVMGVSVDAARLWQLPAQDGDGPCHEEYTGRVWRRKSRDPGGQVEAVGDGQDPALSHVCSSPDGPAACEAHGPASLAATCRGGMEFLGPVQCPGRAPAGEPQLRRSPASCFYA